MAPRIIVIMLAGLVLLLAVPTPGRASKLAKGSGKGIYVVQNSGTYDDHNMDVLLAYADTENKAGWVRSWGRPVNEYLASMTSDPSGNALICGDYGTPQQIDYVPTPSFILKFSSSGDLLWARDIGWSYFSVKLTDIATDSAGNVYATGNAWKYDEAPQPGGWFAVAGFVFTIKLDQSGEMIWAKRWTPDATDMPYGQAIVSNGNEVVVAAYYDNNSNGNSEVLMLWYSASDGTLVASQGWGRSDVWVRPQEMVYGPNGGVYVVCWNSDDTDVALLKYSTGRFLQFAQGWGTSALDYGADISAIGDSVFISGNQQVGTAAPDEWGYAAPMYDGLLIEYVNDVLSSQTICHDSGSTADTVFHSVLARAEDDVWVSGSGPVQQENVVVQEAKGSGWYIQGSTSNPTAYEEMNCGANSFAITGVNATTPMELSEFAAYCDNKRLFIGLVDWLDPEHTPDTRITADVTSGAAPLTVNFSSAKTTIPFGSIANYSWDMNIDDGLDYDIDTGLTPTTQFTFTEPGTYTVAVNATSDDGTEMPATIQIHVT